MKNELTIRQLQTDLKAEEKNNELILELRQKIQQNENQVTLLEKQLVDKQNQIDRVQELVNSQKQLLNERESDLGRLNHKFKEDLEQINLTHSQEIEQLHRQISGLNIEIDSLKSKLSTIQAESENS